jgi:hypothetical protein
MSAMSEGAALIECESVIRKSVTCSINVLKEWGLRNAKYLLENEPETRDYGFIVVTSTFRTGRCALRCWPKANTTFFMKTEPGETVVTRGNDSSHNTAQWREQGWIKVPMNEDAVRMIPNPLTFRIRMNL